MRVLIAAAALAAALLPSIACAEDLKPKGPPKTMGDEGKLPPTGTMRTPEMGATGAGAGTSGSGAATGPGLRMGDEGKLPATGGMSGATPKMNPPPAGDGK